MYNTDNIKLLLGELFNKWSGEKAAEINLLPESGSIRKYFLISSASKTAIGAFNPDKRENNAFISLTDNFFKAGLNVPEVLAENTEENIYLVSYLGNQTLYDYLTARKADNKFTDELIAVYKKVIEELPKFQITGGKNIDYSVCYPRKAFDRQSMMWDLNYFKYYFLKLAQIQFDEQLLEDDFNTFTDYLLSADCSYFLYRDFQSRNIMLQNGSPYFIDYQGGRKGALQYDIASLLYDAKADIPQDVRDILLEYYIEQVNKLIKVNKAEFTKYYQAYSLIRIMQAMGAYGYRGFYEKKSHFLQSIPYAIRNIQNILSDLRIPLKLDTLVDVLNKLVASETLKKAYSNDSILNISINSFSYKRQIPIDRSGNGGGFVFDCRAVNNPGREARFKTSTGKDEDIRQFLQVDPEMNSFLRNVFELVDQSVNNYQQRKFTSLMVSFGCTGGQHRSVYSAEKLAEHLNAKFKDININLHHTELELNNIINK